MMVRQLSNPPGVICSNGQQVETGLFDSRREIVGRVKLAEGGLDRNLPKTCNAHRRRLSFDLRPQRSIDLLAVPGEEPQQGVGVDQHEQDYT